MRSPGLHGPVALQLSADNCLMFKPEPGYTAAAIASLTVVSKHYACGVEPVITLAMR